MTRPTKSASDCYRLSRSSNSTWWDVGLLSIHIPTRSNGFSTLRSLQVNRLVGVYYYQSSDFIFRTHFYKASCPKCWIANENRWSPSNTDRGRHSGPGHQSLHSHVKPGVEVMYMPDYDALNGKRADLPRIIGYRNINRDSAQQKRDYCIWFHTRTCQRLVQSSTIIYSWTSGIQLLISTGMDLWLAQQPLMQKYRRLFLRPYNHTCYITWAIQRWLDIQVNKVCKTLCEENITDDHANKHYCLRHSTPFCRYRRINGTHREEKR